MSSPSMPQNFSSRTSKNSRDNSLSGHDPSYSPFPFLRPWDSASSLSFQTRIASPESSFRSAVMRSTSRTCTPRRPNTAPKNINGRARATRQGKLFTAPPDTVTIIFVFGGPGAGLNTALAQVTEQYAFVHIHFPELLRQEVMNDSTLGQTITRHHEKGLSVPMNLRLHILRQSLKTNAEKGRYFFFVSGLLMIPDDYKHWRWAMKSYAYVAFALLLDCPESIRQQRLTEQAKFSPASSDSTEKMIQRLACAPCPSAHLILY